MDMTKEIASRLKDSLKSQIVESSKEAQTVIIKSSSDCGVRRNLGRNGARYAPKSITELLYKMQAHSFKHKRIFAQEVSSQHCEKVDFEKAQLTESEKIKDVIQSCLGKQIIHLGGGHDHVFPFLKAIQELNNISEIFIINIDAHCDTRISNFKNSGTPFRDFDNLCHKKCSLIQYGIHQYSNSKDTLKDLNNISSTVYAKRQSHFIDNLLTDIPKNAFLLVSLDADALDSSVMEAVSAVNPDGISPEQVHSILNKIKEHQGPTSFGVYEYNPVLDNLSSKGAKTICSLIHNYLS